MQAAFYATPILYPLTKVPEQYRKYFFINPMAQIIQDGRALLISPSSTITSWNIAGPFIIAAPFVIVAFSIVVSRLYFISQAKWFAENI